MSNLAPAPGKNTPQIYRVPLFKKDNIFMIWVGKQAVRYFDQNSLPDLVKVRLGIIMQSPFAEELNTQEMFNTDFEQSQMQSGVYVSKFGPDYEDIGWQFNKYYYCIVMSAEELASIEQAPDGVDPTDKS